MSSDVSVLIPSYNSGDYIGHAIGSALDQQGVHTEVVVHDGGSSDGTLDVLKALEGPRVRWESAPDDGQADALNRALRRAQGAFVMWLNADDLIVPGAVGSLVEVAQREGADVVHGDYEVIDAQGIPIKRYTSAPLATDRLLRNGPYVFSGALLIRRELLDRIGGLDDRLHYCMDYELLFRLVDGAQRTAQVPQVIAQFRRQPESKSESVWLPFLREWLAVARRYGASVPLLVRVTLWLSGYRALRPFWRSRVWLRVRPQKHLGGTAG